MIPQKGSRVESNVSFTESQITAAKNSLFNGMRVVVFKDEQGEIQVKTGRNTKEFIAYCADNHIRNDPDLLRAIVDTIFQSTLPASENPEQLLSTLDRIISVYGDDEASLSQLQAIRKEYQSRFHHRPEPLSIYHTRNSTIGSTASLDSPTSADALLPGPLDSPTSPLRSPSARPSEVNQASPNSLKRIDSPDNKVSNPQKAVESMRKMQTTPLDANLMSTPLMKAASALTKNKKVTFPEYNHLSVLGEVIELSNVTKFNPDNKREVAAWTSFYAKMRVVDSDPDDRKLHQGSNLAQIANFMATLDKSIRYFGVLARYTPLPDTPVAEGMRAQAAEIVQTFRSVRDKLARTPEQAEEIFKQHEEEKIARDQIAALAQVWPTPKESEQIQNWSDFYAEMRVMNVSLDDSTLNLDSPLTQDRDFIKKLRDSSRFFADLNMLSNPNVTQEMKDSAAEIAEVLGDIYDKFQRTPYQASVIAEKRSFQKELTNISASWPTSQLLEKTNPFSSKAHEEINRSLNKVVNGLYTRKEVSNNVAEKQTQTISKGRTVPLNIQAILDLPRTSFLIGDHFFPQAQESQQAAENRLSLIFTRIRSLFPNDERLTDECIGNMISLNVNQTLFAAFEVASFEHLKTILKEDKTVKEDGTVTPRIRAITVNPQNEIVFTSKANYLTQETMEWDINTPFVSQSIAVTVEITIPKETILATGLERLTENDYRVRYHFEQK